MDGKLKVLNCLRLLQTKHHAYQTKKQTQTFPECQGNTRCRGWFYPRGTGSTCKYIFVFFYLFIVYLVYLDLINVFYKLNV